MADVRTLHVVARNSDGRIVHRPIGRALVVADFDAGLTTLALRAGLEPLASFLVDSPSEAADAIETLDELGDVDFDPSDFAPRWFARTLHPCDWSCCRPAARVGCSTLWSCCRRKRSGSSLSFSRGSHYG